MGNSIKDRQLESLADSIISFLCDESDAGRLRIKEAVNRAGKAYTQKDNYKVVKWALKLFGDRGRKKELQSLNINMDDLTAEMTKNDDRLSRAENTLVCLQRLAIVLLDADGGWENTSLNTYLTVYFMGLIDNCEHPTKETFYFQQIKGLKPKLLSKLQQAIQAYQFSLDKAHREQAEVDRIDGDKKRETIDFICLTSDSTKAKSTAKENPGMAVFSLVKNNDHWELKWFDLFGEPLSLPINSYLLQLLKSGKSLQDEAVKLACFKARESFLSKNKILLLPSQSLLCELKSTYVVKQLGEEAKLDWYDDLGLCHQVDLTEYPDLLAFLQKPQSAVEEDLPTLQHHVRRVNCMKQAGIGSARMKLEAFFASTPESTAPTLGLLINPKADALNHLESVFVLSHGNGEDALKWYDAFGKGQTIDLNANPDVQNWLDAHMEIKASDHNALKLVLAKIDRSKALEIGNFKEELANCLANRKPPPATQVDEVPQSKPGTLDTGMLLEFSKLYKPRPANTVGSANSTDFNP
jgi:hypothetical protein